MLKLVNEKTHIPVTPNNRNDSLISAQQIPVVTISARLALRMPRVKPLGNLTGVQFAPDGPWSMGSYVYPNCRGSLIVERYQHVASPPAAAPPKTKSLTGV